MWMRKSRLQADPNGHQHARHGRVRKLDENHELSEGEGRRRLHAHRRPDLIRRRHRQK